MKLVDSFYKQFLLNESKIKYFFCITIGEYEELNR